MNRLIRVLGLAAVTAGALGVAWQQHRASVASRALAAHARTETDAQRAAQARLELPQEAAAPAATMTEGVKPAVPAVEPAAAQPPLEAIQKAMAEAARRQRIRRLMQWERYVRPRFESLTLTPEQWDEFKRLALQRAEAAQNGAAGAGDAAGENRLRALLGDEPFGRFRAVEQRVAAMNDPGPVFARELADDLRFTAEPLTPEQAKRVTTWVETVATEGTANRVPRLRPDALAAAPQHLTPGQVAALGRMQARSDLHLQVDDLAARSAKP